MDVDPPAVAPVPYSRLLRLLRVRMTLLVDKLSDPDVCDGSGVVSQQVHVRVDDVHVAVVPEVFQIVEIKFVEIESLDQISECLGFECRQMGVA